MAMNKLSWPVGWMSLTFDLAFLAVRQHRIPDFSSDIGLSPKSVRQVITEVEKASEALGHYIFDTHVHPEPWQPAPHIPRCVLERIERIYVRDYSNPTRILKLSDEGQDEELLLTRACRDCGDMVVVTVGMAAQAVRKHNLQKGKYRPPWRCRTCSRTKKRSSGLRVPVGVQIQSKKSAAGTESKEAPTTE